MPIRSNVQTILDQIINGSITEVILTSVALDGVDEHTKSNLLQKDEVAALADALVSPSSRVTSLDLLGNKEVTIAAKIAGALKNPNCKLTTLDLMYCDIRVEGSRLIASALTHENCVVKELYLVGNGLGDDGAKIIADALKSSKNVITELYLDKNKIGDEGAKALASALEHDSCNVVNITLDENEIGDVGAKALAKALTHKNCNVEKICIDSNKFKEQGAKAFAEAIELNKEIKNVGLKWHNVGVAGRNALEAAGLNFLSGEIKRNNLIRNVINLASKHKAVCVLAGVAACAIVLCYNKPEILTNAKGMVAKLFDNVSSFAMGK